MIQRLTAITAVGAVLLAGCSGFRSSEPATQTYVLRPPLPAAVDGTAVAADASLAVLRPAAAPGLAGERIALIESGQRLDWYRDARWPDELPALLRSQLIEALRAAGHFASVQGDEAPFAASYLLAVEIRHFEADYTGGAPPRVRVVLTATLGRRLDRAILQSVDASAEVPAEADRLQSVTAAFQTALGQALAQLTGSLQPPGH